MGSGVEVSKERESDEVRSRSTLTKGVKGSIVFRGGKGGVVREGGRGGVMEGRDSGGGADTLELGEVTGGV